MSDKDDRYVERGATEWIAAGSAAVAAGTQLYQTFKPQSPPEQSAPEQSPPPEPPPQSPKE
jgi:hypothetical protein